jgi:hypothetical protein
VLKDNGLRLLLVGYESGNQQILHNIKKGMRVDVARRFTKDCHELGIAIHGTFILGLPGETTETIQETIRFAVETNPHTVQVSLAAPYPGTFLYDQAAREGWLDTANADYVDAHGVQIAPLHYPHLTHTEIFDSVETFYRRFYFRAPKIASICGEMVRDRRCWCAACARAWSSSASCASGRSRLRRRRPSGALPPRRVIVTADDFGLSPEVNEAVERAHREGVLTAASLMVGERAAPDAVAVARRNPGLAVGLHLTLTDGAPVLPAERIPALVESDGRFCDDVAGVGLALAASAAARAQLRAEVAAQVEAFRATGLVCDHLNAHKHFHMHPVIAAVAFRAARGAGIRAVAFRGSRPRWSGLWSPRRAPRRGRSGPSPRCCAAWPCGTAWRRRTAWWAWPGPAPSLRTASPRCCRACPRAAPRIYLHPAARDGFAGGAPGYRHARSSPPCSTLGCAPRAPALASGGYAAMLRA